MPEAAHPHPTRAYGDPAVRVYAERQQGVVSTVQLHAVRLGRGSIAWRSRHERLVRLDRAVYAVGHTRLTWRGHLWAAVLACGGPDHAVLSHWSAAALHDLAPAATRPIHLIARTHRRSTQERRVHRTRILAADDIVELDDGLRVTSVARTLKDPALVVSLQRIESLCERAELLRLLDARDFENTRSANLRAALEKLARVEPATTRNDLERRFLALCDDAGLPRPLVNHPLLGFEIDFLWSDHRLAVETDGRAAHLRPAAFEDDRRRDVALSLAGYRVLRFTQRQVFDDPHYVQTALAEALAQTGATRS